MIYYKINMFSLNAKSGLKIFREKKAKRGFAVWHELLIADDSLEIKSLCQLMAN